MATMAFGLGKPSPGQKQCCRCQTESKTIVNEELQDGTGMDKARSAWKLLHIKVGLSPFLLMGLHLILHYYSCTATTLYCHFRNIEVESNDGSHLESLDALGGPGRRIFKKCALARWRPNGDKI